MILTVITTKVTPDRRKDHGLGPSVGLGCDRQKDHRGIEDTELLDICGVMRESRVKIKLLWSCNDYYGIVYTKLDLILR